MGGGGKGRTTSETSTIELPPGLNEGANEVLAAGMLSASMPYTPNRGVTVAAFAPQELAAMKGANMQASAYGLPNFKNTESAAGIPKAGTGPMGIKGYGTGSIYSDIVKRSTGDGYRRKQGTLLENYSNAAGRIYEAAEINPGRKGIFEDAPKSSGVDILYPGNQGQKTSDTGITNPGEQRWFD